MSDSEEEVPRHRDGRDEEESGESDIENGTRKRGPNKKYIFMQDFDTYEEAKEYLSRAEQQKWVYQYERRTEQGTKRYYSSKYTRNCIAFGYILLHADEFKSSWYCTEQHEHEAAQQKRGLSQETKDMVVELLQQKVSTPALIVAALERKQVVVDPKKIANFLSTYRKKTYGDGNISLTELKQWCNKRMDIPEDHDQPFVGAFEYKVESDELNYFRLFLTTIRLLQNIFETTHLAADGTYKLIYQGSFFVYIFAFL